MARISAENSLQKDSQGGHMNRTLKMLLRTGLNILEQSDRATEPIRDHLAETADMVRRRIRGEDHTLRYVLTFAAGVGVGLGVGILTAPASGEQSRTAIAGKMRGVAERAKNISARSDLGTGT